MTVSFDADAHEYHVDGVKVPSVTQILKESGWVNAKFYAPAAAHRGTAAHEAIGLADAGVVDAEYFTQEIVGYVMAFLKFRRESGWHTEGSEEIVFSPQWAGTQDLRGTLNGVPTIIDIKTGKPNDWHGVQLAAYKSAPYRKQADGTIVEQDNEAVQVRNLYVHKDGRYQLVDRHNAMKYDSPTWMQRWQSALKVAVYAGD